MIYLMLSKVYLFFFIATLGSILDSQLSWESGKSQLARWSHRVVLFSGLDHPPTPHPPTAKLFLILLCGVPTSTKYVRCPPLLVYVFSRSHLFSSSKKYVRCPPPNVAFSDIVVRCPHLNKVCAVSPLLVYVFSRSHLFFSSKKYVRCPPPKCSFLPLLHLDLSWTLINESWEFGKMRYHSLSISVYKIYGYDLVWGLASIFIMKNYLYNLTGTVEVFCYSKW